jgi:3-dehydroquinate synthase
MSAVFLIGFMGAGKSTVGRLLASRLGRRFVDLDTEIEREQGADVASIFAAGGEAAFRDAEREALSALAGADDAVVACGGGVVTDPGSRKLLSRGTVVYLRVSSEEALARIGSETTGRPLLRSADPAAVSELLGSRESLYSSAADMILDTSGRTPETMSERIVELLEGME